MSESLKSGAGRRDPQRSLTGCHRIVFVGRTGSGKTTLAREVASRLGVTHVELDSLHFQADLTTVPYEVLRARIVEALDGQTWVADGNKKSARDLVWPRADTIVWLDYPLVVSLWRLARRANSRARQITSVSDAQPRGAPDRLRTLLTLRNAARGVIKALRSHAGQRREYPRLFALPENAHLSVARLTSPAATEAWLATAVPSPRQQDPTRG